MDQLKVENNLGRHLAIKVTGESFRDKNKEWCEKFLMMFSDVFREKNEQAFEMCQKMPPSEKSMGWISSKQNKNRKVKLIEMILG